MRTLSKPLLCIVTPALADANNGNWQTARRWARLLSGHYRVVLLPHWPAAELNETPAALIALHARRSAASIEAWASVQPKLPLLLVLTGTDLYRDIAQDARAQASLVRAQRLVVLHPRGALALPEGLRAACSVVLQSSPARQPLARPRAWLRVLAVGHLRGEKAPQTLFDAARLLRPEDGIRIEHIGGALDPALGEAARATALVCPHYRWLGALPQPAVLRRLQRAHLLVHPSRLEGGANAVVEAIRSGTAVLASAIEGNRGLLGEAYGGYFPQGDAQALSECLRACRAGQDRADGLLARLQAQCAELAPLFAPEAERQALLTLLNDAVGQSPRTAANRRDP